jgi:hypothetical protein
MLARNVAIAGMLPLEGEDFGPTEMTGWGEERLAAIANRDSLQALIRMPALRPPRPRTTETLSGIFASHHPPQR